MKTRITDLFAIEHPILLSGMSWISVPKMVAAVSTVRGRASARRSSVPPSIRTSPLSSAGSELRTI